MKVMMAYFSGSRLVQREELNGFSMHEADSKFIRMFFEMPASTPVTATVYVYPLPGKPGRFRWVMGYFDWYATSTPGFFPYALQLRPALDRTSDKSPGEYAALMRCAQDYWRPVTALPYAAKLIPAIEAMSDEERGHFLGTLGQKRNPQTLRKLRERFVMTALWTQWEHLDMPYEQRVSELHELGFPLTMATFKKEVQRHTKDFPRRSKV